MLMIREKLLGTIINIIKIIQVLKTERLILSQIVDTSYTSL